MGNENQKEGVVEGGAYPVENVTEPNEKLNAMHEELQHFCDASDSGNTEEILEVMKNGTITLRDIMNDEKSRIAVQKHFQKSDVDKHFLVVKELLIHPKISSSTGFTSVFYLMNVEPDMQDGIFTELTKNNIDPRIGMLEMAESGNIDLLEKYIGHAKKSLKMNDIKNEKGDSILHICARSHNPEEIMPLLIERGGELGLKNEHNQRVSDMIIDQKLLHRLRSIERRVKDEKIFSEESDSKEEIEDVEINWSDSRLSMLAQRESEKMENLAKQIQDFEDSISPTPPIPPIERTEEEEEKDDEPASDIVVVDEEFEKVLSTIEELSEEEIEMKQKELEIEAERVRKNREEFFSEGCIKKYMYKHQKVQNSSDNDPKQTKEVNEDEANEGSFFTNESVELYYHKSLIAKEEDEKPDIGNETLEEDDDDAWKAKLEEYGKKLKNEICAETKILEDLKRFMETRKMIWQLFDADTTLTSLQDDMKSQHDQLDSKIFETQSEYHGREAQWEAEKLEREAEEEKRKREEEAKRKLEEERLRQIEEMRVQRIEEDRRKADEERRLRIAKEEEADREAEKVRKAQVIRDRAKQFRDSLEVLEQARADQEKFRLDKELEYRKSDMEVCVEKEREEVALEAIRRKAIFDDLLENRENYAVQRQVLEKKRVHTLLMLYVGEMKQFQREDFESYKQKRQAEEEEIALIKATLEAENRRLEEEAHKKGMIEFDEEGKPVSKEEYDKKQEEERKQMEELMKQLEQQNQRYEEERSEAIKRKTQMDRESQKKEFEELRKNIKEKENKAKKIKKSSNNNTTTSNNNTQKKKKVMNIKDLTPEQRKKLILRKRRLKQQQQLSQQKKRGNNQPQQQRRKGRGSGGRGAGARQRGGKRQNPQQNQQQIRRKPKPVQVKKKKDDSSGMSFSD